MRSGAYPEYRDSGVAYLGSIPASWRTQRLKHIAKYWVSNVDKVAAENEIPIRLCNYTDVYYNECLDDTQEFMETTATLEEIARFSLKEGDVIITKDSESWDDIAVPALVKKVKDLVCGYHLAFIRSDQNHVIGKFLLRYLQSPQINQHFQVAATGVTRFGLPKNEIGSLSIALPPIPDQQKICSFIDCKAAQIGTLIRKKEELIEKLQEKRSTLISRIVTRGLPPEAAKAAGLNPHPKLKPSGIEWLGEIPEQWNVIRLRHACCEIFLGLTSRVDYVDDAGFPLVRAVNIAGGILDFSDVRYISKEQHRQLTKHHRAKQNDVLLSKSGSIGTAALVDVPDEFSIYESIFALRSRLSLLVPKYLLYLLRSSVCQSQYSASLVGMGVGHLNMSDVVDLRIALPPLPEQHAAVDYLNKQIAKLDLMSVTVEAAIDKLQEYRSALITAAITGKIDVRNYTGD